MFSLLQCRMKNKAIDEEILKKKEQRWQLQTKPLTLIALMIMHSIPVHGEVKGVGLVDQIWLSLQDCDNEGEIIKLFRLTCKECCYQIYLTTLQNYLFLEQCHYKILDMFQLFFPGCMYPVLCMCVYMNTYIFG